MKLNIKIAFALCIYMLCSAGMIRAQDGVVDGWELEKDKDGIKVYTRIIEGMKIKEFKSIAIIESRPELLLNIIREVDKYPEWMSHLDRSYIEKKINENELYIYSESKVPWPFTNRDVITHSLLSWQGDTAIVEMTGVPDFIPVNDGIIRMPFSKGWWYFVPIGENLTKVIYQFGGDPGGSIPAWVINIFIVDGPYKTLLGMKNIAKSLIKD